MDLPTDHEKYRTAPLDRRGRHPAEGRPLLSARDSGRGILLVTHRLAPLAVADEVVVLGAAAGAATVLARGTHARLYETVPSYRWAVDQELR